METYRKINKLFPIYILATFILGLLSKEYEICFSICLLFILIDSIYFIVEKKSKNITVICTDNKFNWRIYHVGIIAICICGIISTYYLDLVDLKMNFTLIVFISLALRGLIFTNQATQSIRVTNKGLEFGYWHRFVEWKEILFYSIENNSILLNLTDKELIHRFRDKTKINDVEKILIEKEIKSGA